MYDFEQKYLQKKNIDFIKNDYGTEDWYVFVEMIFLMVHM